MKIAFVAILFFSYYCGSAQATDAFISHNKIVGQCNAGTNVLAQLAYDINGFDTVYTFSMLNRHNEEEGKKCSISFPGSLGIIDQLYTAIKHLVFMRNKKRKDYTTTVALGDKLVVLATSRIMGNTAVVIYLPQGSNILTEWQVDKVFGK